MGKKGEKQFRWTKPMEYLMMERADEVKQGNKSTTQFKAISFNRVAEGINQRFGVECSPKHVENHLKTIKRTWNTVQTLLNKSGLGWNDNYKMITASPDVYAAHIQLSTFSATSQKGCLFRFLCLFLIVINRPIPLTINSSTRRLICLKKCLLFVVLIELGVIVPSLLTILAWILVRRKVTTMTFKDHQRKRRWKT